MKQAKDVITTNLILVTEKKDFAYLTAYQKSKNRNTDNTWQKNRSSFRKCTDLFAGDLAKNLVRYWDKQQNITLTDYDQIRIDNFTKPDEFDLSYQHRKIEVKSSIEKMQLIIRRHCSKKAIHYLSAKRI